MNAFEKKNFSCPEIALQLQISLLRLQWRGLACRSLFQAELQKSQKVSLKEARELWKVPASLLNLAQHILGSISAYPGWHLLSTNAVWQIMIGTSWSAHPGLFSVLKNFHQLLLAIVDQGRLTREQKWLMAAGACS